MARPPFVTKLFTASSPVASHPSVAVEVDEACKILGGGAFVNWHGAGNLLTALYPESPTKWIACAKDHGVPDPAPITAWAIALHDPDDEWEVTYVSATSAVSSEPQALVSLPTGFVLAGGGARVNWNGPGSLLSASYPNDGMSWKAEAKNHFFESTASVTVYAIGVRPREGVLRKGSMIFCYESDVVSHPQAKVVLPSGYALTCGGARDNWSGQGNFLTASFPNGVLSWEARGKDHGVVAPSSITVYAVGFPKA